MTSFIKTDNGNFIATTEIVQIEKLHNKKAVIATKQGEKHTILKRPGELRTKIELETAPCVKADQGYSVIFLREDFSTIESAIIAWTRIDSRKPFDAFCSRPVIAGEVGKYKLHAIVDPDGNVRDAAGRIFPNVDVWVEICRKSLLTMQGLFAPNDDYGAEEDSTEKAVVEGDMEK